MITDLDSLFALAQRAGLSRTDRVSGTHSLTGSPEELLLFGHMVASLVGVRDALLNPPAVTRDEYGAWTNPGLPDIGEGTSFKLFCQSLQLDFTYVEAEGNVSDEVWDSFSNGSIAAWTPEPPTGEAWVPLSIHDTEDGPVAMYVRRPPDPNAPLSSEQQERARVEVSYLLALAKNHGDALVAFERAGNGASAKPVADAERDLKIAFRRLVHKAMRISGSLE